MPDAIRKPISQCRRCGTCCAKGGPALHLEDREKVDSGKIPLKNLFTIREGEPAYDNTKRQVAPARTDIIKIKSASGTDAACLFFNRDGAVCNIYEQRPIECRVLTCWDTSALLAIYNKDRLTRGHLLSRLPGLIDLVTEHQARCDYHQVGRWASSIRQGAGAEQAIEALLELIRYDQSLRKVIVERSRLDPEMLEFLFGRPLYLTIRLFRLRIAQDGANLTIKPHM